jgi:hydrogenase maturation factor
MVGYRDVRYVLSIDGMRAEEDLPVGTMRLCCDHRGTVSDFNLQNLRPTSIRLVVPRLP